MLYSIQFLNIIHSLLLLVKMDHFILHTHPSMTSLLGAQHEIHIFLAPLNPDKETVAKYYEAVHEWNEKRQPDFAKTYGNFQMKACVLGLVFRKEKTFEENPITVMQSSVYIKSNSMKRVI